MARLSGDSKLANSEVNRRTDMTATMKYSRVRIGVATACIVATLTALWTVSRYAWRAQGAVADAEMLEALGGREYLIKCDACGQQFKMSAKAYLMLVQARDSSSNDGIACSLCGEQRAWREYGERHWDDAAETVATPVTTPADVSGDTSNRGVAVGTDGDSWLPGPP